MKFRNLITTAAVTLATVGIGISTAQAQTLTVTGTSSLSGGIYTYSYVATPSAGFSINQLMFNFVDTNFTSTPTTSVGGPLTYNAGASVPAGGVFSFINLTTPLTTAETFIFTSPDAPGSTVGAIGISYSGSGVAATNPSSTQAPAPTPAPEPGSFVSMGVLSACLGLGIVARKRKALSV